MEHNIIQKLQQGDEQEVELLVRELYPKIFAYIYRRIYDSVSAKDLTQDTFYKFFQHIDQYVENGKLLNYLYRIAYHLIQDTYKKQTIDVLNEENYQDTTFDAHQTLMKQEEFLVLRKWVEELPPHLQEVIRLRYDENLKFKDIAEIMEIHVSTIKSRFKLAIEILQVKAEEEGFE